MRAALIVFLSLVVLSFQAQERIGAGISNYSPTTSLLLNPSSIVDSKAFLDIHLVGLGVFARNNLVYLPGDQFTLTDPSTYEGLEPAFDLDKRQYRAYTNLLVQGPTVTVNIGRHAVGLYTGARAMTDVRGVGSRTAQYLLEGLQYGPFIGEETRIRNLRATGLGWAELGLSYGTILKSKGNDLLTGAIHVKRLIGIAGVGVRLNDWHFAVPDSNTIETFTLNGGYAVNEPGWNSGRGWGVDIGITYKRTLNGVTNYEPHTKKGGCETCDYRFKLSAAILDIGRIRFDPEFFTGDLSADEGDTWEDFDAENPSNLSEVAQVIDNNFADLSDEDQLRMRVFLPTALSVQMDYNLGYNFYANGSLILGAPWRNSFGVQRAAMLSVTPRYEIRRFEAALPLSLHEMREPMLGAMIRLNSIIIGTDNLGTYLFGNNDVYGADIYLHIKYTIFRTWGCRKAKNRVSRAKGGGRVVPCASW